MSRLIKLLNNETIEIVEYSKANAYFQTNEYPSDELVCVIRETFNPFDLFNDNKIKDMEIERLNNIINELGNYLNEQVDYMTHHSIERMVAFDCCRHKLQELKGDSSNE